MRLGQAIDSIFQDISKEYEATCNEGFVYKLRYSTFSNEIVLFDGYKDSNYKCNILANFLSEMDWKLLQEPVSFMEAVESGKDFMIKHSILKNVRAFDDYLNIREFLQILARDFTDGTASKILIEGEFYIEEEY